MPGLFDEDGDLWLDASADYHEAPPTDDDVRSIEAELGYRLPAAYVALARRHNGGLLRRDAHRCPNPTSWADDHVGITGIFAIGRTAQLSLCGPGGQELWLREWGYPALGVYFADTPSAGHDMIALDYRACGPQGEPTVVHVDQEAEFAVTQLAPTFEEFLQGLAPEESFLE